MADRQTKGQVARKTDGPEREASQRHRLKRYMEQDRLVGLVVKASASRAEGPGFESRLRRDFFGVESYQ